MKVEDLQLVSNYKDDAKKRKSFNDLAILTFGISFEEWYQKGFWNERYIPYSFVQGDQVIANVSVNLIDLVIDGQLRMAVQVGTVMTHPDYRNQGLSSRLMKKVLQEYEDACDFFYLFANQSVLDFYPKFGFQEVKEQTYSMSYSPPYPYLYSKLKKLDGTNLRDLSCIYEFAADRVSASEKFGAINAHGILMFHCLYDFPDDIYYIQEDDCIVIFKQQGGTLHLYDIISKEQVQLEKILPKIANGNDLTIIFHFTPELTEWPMRSERLNGDDVLYVKSTGNGAYPELVKHPVVSQA
ncbi:hypothetical protein N780_15530 [Pontibacillus chungwhensis BH030062]|uniref:N-acetyltransferase domain-containing protein n=1 Tax=Pontibacillus chungwhensis BH030062 TaxID=1385513 RepID=A0A0A2UV42_9BACI|nr:GNAT family N-acetyltransferase [Pontibacillus chungwhensis]KGP91789.1 hypothetical protein N780_15530 [Pontibacillus chungwhensis BH030062]